MRRPTFKSTVLLDFAIVSLPSFNLYLLISNSSQNIIAISHTVCYCKVTASNYSFNQIIPSNSCIVNTISCTRKGTKDEQYYSISSNGDHQGGSRRIRSCSLSCPAIGSRRAGQTHQCGPPHFGKSGQSGPLSEYRRSAGADKSRRDAEDHGMNSQEKRPSGCCNIQNGPAVEKCDPAQFHRPYSITEKGVTQ